MISVKNAPYDYLVRMSTATHTSRRFRFAMLLFIATAPVVLAQHAIIPVPVRAVIQPGAFHIDENTVILYDSDSAEVAAVARYLAERIALVSSFSPAVSRYSGESAPRNSIFLSLRKPDANATPEGYALRISPHGMRLSATAAPGLFYGVQTFRQLLPARFESSEGRDTVKGWDAPCCLIVDAPRFPWRGLLLDCARHFMDVDIIKRSIDMLALLKMNRLHWHLTDDQGWRIEIRKHPVLTAVGAWREEADGSRYGGFYTQEQIRDVVAYATERHVTVVPEIEMPGHARAALASYPALSCTGESQPVPHTWGVFEDVFCAGNDATFTFIEEVLDEVLVLFPSPYIHIGGDEVPKRRWSQCDACRKRMAQEQLVDEHALQSWFITRIEDYLSSRGRRLIGWDEILEGGLPPRATVQSWRGMQGAVEAVASGHDAIVSPTSHAYFDYPLTRIDMETVYGFDPMPAEIKPSQQEHILGGECNMWTEYVPQDLLESKLYPRMLAMSEALWIQPMNRTYLGFQRRVQEFYSRLDTLRVHYGFETQPVYFRIAYDSAAAAMSVALEGGQPGLRLEMLDMTRGGDVMPIESPARVSGSGVLGAVARKGERLRSDTALLRYDLHDAIHVPVGYGRRYSTRYSGGGDSALVDGVRGSTDHRDGRWQGFSSGDIVLTLDLGKPRALHGLSVGLLQRQEAWIFLPRSVTFSLSDDGFEFRELPTVNVAGEDRDEAILTRDIRIDAKGERGQYLRVHIDASAECPAWHPGAGKPSWVFVDEVVVR